MTGGETAETSSRCPSLSSTGTNALVAGPHPLGWHRPPAGTATVKHGSRGAESIVHKEVQIPLTHKEVHGMSSNQMGPGLDAPSYGVTWGGLPMYARRAMTVGLATLV